MIMREIATNYDDVTLDSRLPARALQVFMCGARTGLSVGPCGHRLADPTHGKGFDRRRRPGAGRAWRRSSIGRARHRPSVG